MMRPLAYPLTPVPASIATNVFLYTSPPTRCCTAFLKCPKKMALLVKVMVRLVCLCVCVRRQKVYECVFFSVSCHGLHVLHPFLSSSVPSSSSLYPPQVVVTSVDLCMDCVCMDFLLLTVTLTTVSIVSVTHTANKFRHCRVALRECCLLLPLLASQKLMHHPNSRCAAASAASAASDVDCCVVYPM